MRFIQNQIIMKCSIAIAEIVHALWLFLEESECVNEQKHSESAHHLPKQRHESESHKNVLPEFLQFSRDDTSESNVNKACHKPSQHGQERAKPILDQERTWT